MLPGPRQCRELGRLGKRLLLQPHLLNKLLHHFAQPLLNLVLPVLHHASPEFQLLSVLAHLQIQAMSRRQYAAGWNPAEPISKIVDGSGYTKSWTSHWNGCEVALSMGGRARNHE